jgi:hypothetical protein
MVPASWKTGASSFCPRIIPAEAVESAVWVVAVDFRVAKKLKSWHLQISSTKGRPNGGFHNENAKRATSANELVGL